MSLVVPSGLLKQSFFTSYLVLMGYTGLTFIEALRTENDRVRHIMNIETTVSLIAGLVYSLFNEKMKESKVDLRELVQLRYLDWMITTPLILLAILLYYNPDYKNVNYKTYGIVLALNWGMLAAGYGGETGKLSEMTGGVIGFIFFAILLWWMNYCCVPASANHTVFYLFAIIWTFYGVAYYMKDYEEKNVTYNALDVLSKAIFGIVLWLYFGHVISFK